MRQRTHVATDGTPHSLRLKEAHLRASVARLAVLDEGTTPRGLAMAPYLQAVIEQYELLRDFDPKKHSGWVLMRIA